MTIQSHSPAAARVFAWSGAVLFAGSIGWFLYCYFVRFGGVIRSGPFVAPVATNVLLFGLFAAHHSLLARSGLKRRVVRLVGPRLERPVYTWVASLLFIIVCTVWQPVPGVIYQLPGALAVVGYAVQAAGVGLTLGAARAVDFLELAGVRHVEPVASAAQAEPELQTTGLYGLVRHPLYFAWALMVFGAPTMTATRLTFAVISTGYLFVAIHWEERSLVDTFGEEYEGYRRRVRWRIIPGIY